MNTYDRLEHHLETYKYVKGINKGDAPADASNRAKSYFRVVQGNGCMVVHLHRTNILVAYPDGRVKLNTDGWYTSPTTRECVAHSMMFVTFPCSGITTCRVKGLSQPVIYVGDTGYLYYDGIMFDADGKPLTELRAFEQRHIDKNESGEFMRDMKASGFTAAFPLLYATAPPQNSGGRGKTSFVMPRRVRELLTDIECAPHWSAIISDYKFTLVWNPKAGHIEMLEMGTAKSCWASMMTYLKLEMYVTTRSDVYTLPRK